MYYINNKMTNLPFMWEKWERDGEKGDDKGFYNGMECV